MGIFVIDPVYKIDEKIDDAFNKFMQSLGFDMANLKDSNDQKAHTIILYLLENAGLLLGNLKLTLSFGKGQYGYTDKMRNLYNVCKRMGDYAFFYMANAINTLTDGKFYLALDAYSDGTVDRESLIDTVTKNKLSGNLDIKEVKNESSNKKDKPKLEETSNEKPISNLPSFSWPSMKRLPAPESSEKVIINVEPPTTEDNTNTGNTSTSKAASNGLGILQQKKDNVLLQLPKRTATINNDNVSRDVTMSSSPIASEVVVKPNQNDERISVSSPMNPILDSVFLKTDVVIPQRKPDTFSKRQQRYILTNKQALILANKEGDLEMINMILSKMPKKRIGGVLNPLPKRKILLRN